MGDSRYRTQSLRLRRLRVTARSAFIDTISRSPFLPFWNLHKVEPFFYITHFKLEMFMKMQVSSKQIDIKSSRIWTHDPEDLVYHTNY